MNTCKDCKFWSRNTTSYHPIHCGQCSNEKIIYDPVAPPKDGLSYYDYEGYMASILTGEDFGCIHWESK